MNAREPPEPVVVSRFEIFERLCFSLLDLPLIRLTISRGTFASSASPSFYVDGTLVWLMDPSRISRSGPRSSMLFSRGSISVLSRSKGSLDPGIAWEL